MFRYVENERLLKHIVSKNTISRNDSYDLIQATNFSLFIKDILKIDYPDEQRYIVHSSSRLREFSIEIDGDGVYAYIYHYMNTKGKGARCYFGYNPDILDFIDEVVRKEHRVKRVKENDYLFDNIDFVGDLANISRLRLCIKNLWGISSGGNAEYGHQWQVPYFKLDDVSIWIKKIKSKRNQSNTADVMIFKIKIDIKQMGIDVRNKLIERYDFNRGTSDGRNDLNIRYSEAKYYMPYSYFMMNEHVDLLIEKNNSNGVLEIDALQKNINDMELSL